MMTEKGKKRLPKKVRGYTDESILLTSFRKPNSDEKYYPHTWFCSNRMDEGMPSWNNNLGGHFISSLVKHVENKDLMLCVGGLGDYDFERLYKTEKEAEADFNDFVRDVKTRLKAYWKEQGEIDV